MDWYYIVLIVLGGLIIIALGCGYALTGGVLSRGKDLVFDPSKMSDNELKFHNYVNGNIDKFNALNPETLTLNCSDGKRRRGYFIKNESSDVLIIFSHGWKSKGMINFGITGEYALEQKYNILVVDHLGHGESESNVIGFGIKDYYALIEWCDFIQKKENKDFKIFMHGVSMGSNTCLLCADKKVEGLKGIIADCGFTNAWDELCFAFKKKYHLPLFPGMPVANLICKLFLKMDLKKLSTLDTVSKSNVPIYYIHGELDDFVPTRMTIENDKVTNTPHQVWISEGCKHAATAYKYRDEYKNTIVTFIEKYKNI